MALTIHSHLAPSFIFFLIFPPNLVQAVQGHSAPCVSVSISIMNEIPPVMHLLFRFNFQGSIVDTGGLYILVIKSSDQVFRIMPFESSVAG